MKVIIDTDIAIDFLRGDKTVENILSKLWEDNATCISILVKDVSLKIAEYGGGLFKKYRKARIILTTVDCLIMATAYF